MLGSANDWDLTLKKYSYCNIAQKIYLYRLAY